MLIRILVIIFIFITFVYSCRDKNENQQADSELLVYLLNTQTSSSVRKSCNDFASIEQACVENPDLINVTCSDSELERIRKGIEPENKRNDEILSAFFDCWSKCNLLYNSQDSVCLNRSYSTSKVYRDSQKNGETQASISWGLCMEKCNQGESEESSLKDANVFYTSQVY